jgi:hypothetical protein
VPPAATAPSLRVRHRDREAGDRALVDHRAGVAGAVGRVAHHQLGGARGQALHQLVVHRVEDDGARACAALLAREAIGGGRDALGRRLQVGAVADDRGVLAPHLHDRRARVGPLLEAAPQRAATSADPVKTTPSMALSASARPAASPPWTRFTTPAGSPALA